MTRGHAARRLLEGDDFSAVMNDLDTFHLSALVACHPGPATVDTRDYHHRQLHALREIIAEVTSREQALAAFEESHGGAPDEQDDDA